MNSGNALDGYCNKHKIDEIELIAKKKELMDINSIKQEKYYWHDNGLKMIKLRQLLIGFA